MSEVSKSKLSFVAFRLEANMTQKCGIGQMTCFFPEHAKALIRIGCLDFGITIVSLGTATMG